MKKTAFWCLLLICCTCIAFTGGFFIGRNANHAPVQVDRIPEATVSQAAIGNNTAATIPGKININTATAEQLQTLPGIGQILAQRIIAYRQANGPFEKPADLDKVEGIGTKILADILDLITAGG